MGKIFEEIDNADKIIVGVSNVFSISEGYHIFANNLDFQKNFRELIAKYTFRSIIHGCFHPFKSSEDEWLFNALMYNYLYAEYKPSQLMNNLIKLVKDKEYFIVTSNIDGHFRKAGIPEERIFEIEGNCLDMQCAKLCSPEVDSAKDVLSKIYDKYHNGIQWSTDIPTCPHCGGKMKVHIEVDHKFAKDEQWNISYKNYRNFLKTDSSKRIVFLELGIGARNQLIKAPFMKMVYSNENSVYITINKGELLIPDCIKDRAYGVDGDLNESFDLILNKKL